jgi:hypothetical protein
MENAEEIQPKKKYKNRFEDKNTERKMFLKGRNYDPQERNCLKCGKEFHSLAKQFRMCENCKRIIGEEE